MPNYQTSVSRNFMESHVREGIAGDWSPGSLPTRRRIGFTLVEILVVMAIMVVLLVLVVPAFNSLNQARDVTRAAYDISGTLDQARAYAMANNTYVFVGLEEVDSSVPSSMSPQTASTSTTGGRVAVAVIASRDGTRGYDVNNPASSWAANYANGANYFALGKLIRIEGLHLADFGPTPPTTGNMARAAIPDPSDSSSPNYRLGNVNAAYVSATPFSWPLGSPNTATGGQYYFTKVINIDPQGVARIQGTGNADAIPQWMEIDLQPTHGNMLPPLPTNQNSGDQIALQIDAMTGAVRMYRP